MFKKLKRQNKDKEFEWTKHDDKVMHAVEAGDIEKLQITLAKKGTSPTKLDPEGKTPLHVAARLGQYPCLEVLLQLGANPRASDGQGCTPLHCASKGGHLNSMHRLIKAGVPINAQDFTGKTALHFSANGGFIESTILLLQCGSTVDVSDEYGKTPLMLASQSGHSGVVKDLIDRGAAVNAQDHLQKTSLMLACENAHKEVVDLLVKRGARADLRDAQGYDAKYYAEASGQPDLVDSLESAPSVATWDVKHDDEDTYDQVTPDAVDYIDTFESANDRAESPPPNKNQQNNISPDIPAAPSRAISMPALTAAKTDEVKELEEENDFLNEELSKLNVAHKKALERIRSLESKSNEQEVETLQHKLEAEESRRLETEKEINELRNKLSAMKVRKSRETDDEDEDKDDDETHSVGSWGDSEDDLFDLPGTERSTRHPNLSMNITSPRSKLPADSQQLTSLRTEVESLRKENENLKNQRGSSDRGDASTVPQSEFEHLRLTSNSKIADLEEELACLKEEMDEIDSCDVVPAEEYDELKQANNQEMSSLKQENVLLKEEIANVSQRLAGMTDRNERLQRQVNEQQELQMRPVSSSSGDFRYNELVEEKLEMEEIINKHTEVLAVQANEIQTYKKDIEEMRTEKEALETRLAEIEMGKSGMKTKEEYDALKSENDRLQATIGKQSKAIAQQTDRMRKDKLKYGEVVAERDRLSLELQNVSTVSDAVDKEKHQELEDENHRLQETIKMLEKQVEGRTAETKKVEELMAENWRLQDAIRKAEDEVLVKTSQVSRLQSAKGGSSDVQRLEEENKKLKEKSEHLETELANRREGDAGYAELLAENLALKVKVSEQETADINVRNGGMSKKKYAEVLAENRKLRENMEKMKNGTVMVNGVDKGGGGGEGGGGASLKEVAKLKQQMSEMEARHRDTVNIYRAHLLSAVQDDISPEVKEALQQIVKLRNGTQVAPVH